MNVGNAVGLAPSTFLRFSSKDAAQTMAIGQNVGSAADPQVPGRLRILGCLEPRTGEMPTGKKHELWIPNAKPLNRPLVIPPAVIARFYAIADERTAESAKNVERAIEKAKLDADEATRTRRINEIRNFAPLPYHPITGARNDENGTLEFRLKDGDIVYFDLDEMGRVSEISLSAIWRGGVKPERGEHVATGLDFFGKVNKDLVPLREGRSCLTIAEQLLGVVEELQKTTERAGVCAEE